MEVARGNRKKAREWFDAARKRVGEVDSPVGGALEAMALAHLNQQEDPALAAEGYWKAAQTWRALNWRLLELKMMVDVAAALEDAAASGSVPPPTSVPPREQVEARIGELAAELNVRRPTPHRPAAPS
jgi:hypothetical protein